MTLRQTELMKRDFINGIDITTYRVRPFGRINWAFRTIVTVPARGDQTLMLDWPTEAKAVTGHEQVTSRIIAGTPPHLITGIGHA